MDTIVGAGVTLGMGVIVIAAIYQLGKSGNPIIPDLFGPSSSGTAGTGGAYQATLSSLFK